MSADQSPLAGAWTIPAGFALLPLESSDALLRPFYECPPEELKLAWQAMHMIAKKMHPAPALPAPAGGWTGNADADLALILLDRLDDTGEGNAVRIEQLEGLVRKLAAAPAAAPAGDPLQGAADWLRQALVNCTETDLQQRLLIGFNRAARLMNAQETPQAVPFADGDSPCVLEWGAVSLPVGDPSRVTNLMLCRTLWDAIAEGALCGFDWRVYPLADVANPAAIQAPATGEQP